MLQHMLLSDLGLLSGRIRSRTTFAIDRSTNPIWLEQVAVVTLDTKFLMVRTIVDGCNQFVVHGVAKTIDGEHFFFGGGAKLLKGMDSNVLQFLDSSSTDAEEFKGFNVDHFFFFDVHVGVFLVVCNGGSTDHVW